MARIKSMWQARSAWSTISTESRHGVTISASDGTGTMQAPWAFSRKFPRRFPGEQKPVLILEALQPAPRYVVLAWRRGLVPLWFSRKPFSHLVVFPERIQWGAPMNPDESR